jgi:hypothetical protein
MITGTGKNSKKNVKDVINLKSIMLNTQQFFCHMIVPQSLLLCHFLLLTRHPASTPTIVHIHIYIICISILHKCRMQCDNICTVFDHKVIHNSFLFFFFLCVWIFFLYFSSCFGGNGNLLQPDPPQVTLSLGSTLIADDIKEGDDVYFECHIKANPKEHRISWSHDVSEKKRVSLFGLFFL